MFNLDGSVEIKGVADLGMLKELIEKFDEPSVDDLYKEYLNQCKEIGIGDLIDKKSLKKAVKDMVENGKDAVTVANLQVPDSEEFIENLKPDEIEVKMTLSLADLSLLTGIFESYKPQKILKRLIKKDVLRDNFETYLTGEMQIDELADKLERTKIGILLKAANKINGEKVTFKAE